VNPGQFEPRRYGGDGVQEWSRGRTSQCQCESGLPDEILVGVEKDLCFVGHSRVFLYSCHVRFFFLCRELEIIP